MPNAKKPIILKASSPLDEAVRIFRAGGVIAFPTETFYALGVDPFNPKAVNRLFSLKGRSLKNPVSIIIKDIEMLKSVTDGIPPAAENLIKKFWPGPLTIIFKAKTSVLPELISNTGKVGVRISGSADCRRIVEALNSPVTATSANPSGKKPPVTAKEVMDYFNGSIDVLIDGGALPGKTGSTVVDATGAEIVIIREGEIPQEEINKTC